MLTIARPPATVRIPLTAGRDESNSRNANNTRDNIAGRPATVRTKVKGRQQQQECHQQQICKQQ
jgi:hypothetical protein